MKSAFKMHLQNWQSSRRKGDLRYALSRLPRLIRDSLRAKRELETDFEPLEPPVETEYVNLLSDPNFCTSVANVKAYTCLDAVRLANLWSTAKLVGEGIFLEVGSFRGGTALHICNAIESRGASNQFFCFDPFEKGGFEKVVPLDNAFKVTDFMNTSYESVASLLLSKPFARPVQGYFPAVAKDLNLHDIAFCHLDVDVYDATRESLEFLAPRLAHKSAIVVDDYGHRETPGVDLAVNEFLRSHPSFLMIPMFPCQVLLLSKALW